MRFLLRVALYQARQGYQEIFSIFTQQQESDRSDRIEEDLILVGIIGFNQDEGLVCVLTQKNGN